MLRLIQSAAVANRSDVSQLAFWWTNACHMRGFLQSLNLVMPRDEVRLPLGVGVSVGSVGGAL